MYSRKEEPEEHVRKKGSGVLQKEKSFYLNNEVGRTKDRDPGLELPFTTPTLHKDLRRRRFTNGKGLVPPGGRFDSSTASDEEGE